MEIDCFTVIQYLDYLEPIMILEQTSGSFRHHQRRCTGQKKSPVSTVVRGSSRLIAAVATKFKTVSL